VKRSSVEDNGRHDHADRSPDDLITTAM